jgi:putative transposase
MKGLAVRIAKGVNDLLATRGGVWADRYHARPLKTPREVRNALIYVIRNRAKHAGDVAFDPRSSAAYLQGGWDERMCAPVARGSPSDWPVALPETWLVNVSWKRLGLLRAHDIPVS